MKPFNAIRVLAGILVMTLSALAQVSTGSISGVVTDQSGAAVPKATVTITDVDTGISRSIVADSDGRYRAPNLLPDHYQVQVENAGFATEIRSGIQVTVGSELQVDMVLKVGETTQKTVVSAEADVVDTQTSTLSGLVDDQSIRDLPLNSRSFDSLIALQSSAPTFTEKNTSAQSGVGVTYSVHGGRDQTNHYLLDGMDMIGAYSFGTQPGGALGLNQGVDAIREFSVLTGNYNAVYGKYSGAVIDLASKTGTNQFHGSAFEFLRNSDLDARNYFDQSIPPFRRNQFGGSIGGPIKRDRAFFFFNYEGLREDLGISAVERVPDNNARQGLVPCTVAGSGFACNTTTNLANVGVAPSVIPFLPFFPVANGSEYGDGTANAVFSPHQLSNQDFYLVRVDYKLSDKDSLFVRYNGTPAYTHTVSNVVYEGTTTRTNLQMPGLQETRVISPTMLNTFRVGVTRAHTFIDQPSTVLLNPALAVIPGAISPPELTFALSATNAGAGEQTLGSITATPPYNSNPQPISITEPSFADDLFYQHGPHSFQFGAELQPNMQVNMTNVQNPAGIYQFSTLLGLLQGKPTNFTGPTPNVPIEASRSFRQTYTDAYAQDDYKMRRTLTLNLGLRWEFMTPPTEAHDIFSNYRYQIVNGRPLLNSSPTLGSPLYTSHKDNFAPRIGFAWDVFGDGKTALRGGFGMYYNQIQDEYRSFSYANAPFISVSTIANPVFPVGFAAGTVNAQLTPSVIAYNLDVPTTVQYNLDLQRQISPNTIFKIGYFGAEGYHLPRRGDLNEAVPQILPGGVYFFSPTAPRANPTLSSSSAVTNDAVSSYNGLDLEVSQRFSHGLRYQASFTWAKSIDTASAIVSGLVLGEPDFSMEESDQKLDRGLSAFDVGRNLVGNLTYDFPWQNSKDTAIRWIGGWEVNGIVTIQDGFPFTPLTGFNRSNNKENKSADRPSLLPGITHVPIVGSPTEYFDPSVFTLPAAGFYGDVGRNSIIGPGLENLDLSLVKVFPVGEHLKVDFRTEAYNLLNRPNFGLPGNQIFTSSGARNASAGVITTTTTISREIQFGIKLLF